MTIKEHDNNNNNPPDSSIPVNTEFFHDAVEGFRIDYNKKNIIDDGGGEKSKTTFLLQKSEKISKNDTNQKTKAEGEEEKSYELAMSIANSLFIDGKFHYSDDEKEENQDHRDYNLNSNNKNNINNIISNDNNNNNNNSNNNNSNNNSNNNDIQKNLQKLELQDTSKNNITINGKKNPQEEEPSPPQKKVQKKKRTVATEMSLFGKIWTALDRMTSKNTRQYFVNANKYFLDENQKFENNRINNDNEEKEEDFRLNYEIDEVKLMRINIFTVKIMEWYF